MSIKIISALCLVCCLISIFSLPAYAVLVPPTTIEIEAGSVGGYRNLIEPGDVLIIARYNINWSGNYSNQPTVPIYDTFYFNWTDSDGNCTSYSTTGPVFPINNCGYGKGIVSWYWDASETCGNSTWPPWGDLGNVTVTGTGLFGGSPPTSTYTMTSSDWCPYSLPQDSRQNLYEYIVDNASILDMDWNNWLVMQGYSSREVDLLQYMSPGYTVLTSIGEAYFLAAIPKLRTMCPMVFAINNILPSPAAAGNYSHAKATSYLHQYDNTEVGKFKTGASEMFGGIGEEAAGTFLTLLFVLAVTIYTTMRKQRALPGLLICAPAVLLFTRMGFPSMAVVFLAVAAGVILLAYAVFWRGSQG
jgi:hypothetical protein